MLNDKYITVVCCLDVQAKLDNFFGLNFVVMTYNLIKQCIVVEK